ncbi:Hypothetical protein D9617_16g014110 [Elsinoe fawcettii]|nr:Hypothetical protein D9617_16g014110 [Elsinoe fawcettii]
MATPLLRSVLTKHTRILIQHNTRSVPSSWASPKLTLLQRATGSERGIATLPLRTPAESKAKKDKDFRSEIPKFNFKDLGANRTVKIVVIVALTIAGTAETVTWVRLIGRWWRGRQEKANEEERETGGSQGS